MVLTSRSHRLHCPKTMWTFPLIALACMSPVSQALRNLRVWNRWPPSSLRRLGSAASSDVVPKSELLRTLHERGFFHQCTDEEELDSKLSSGCVVAYLGFDATASSLHVGSLLQIMLLRHFQRYGVPCLWHPASSEEGHVHWNAMRWAYSRYASATPRAMELS